MTVIVPYAADVADRIRLAVVGGYDSAERIIESLAELIEYDPDAADYVAALGVPLREHIAGLVEAAFEAHRLAEAEFPRVTDCDSISAVLSELERSGILAGEDVGMTMSDVRDDMWAVVDESGRRGQEPRGWVAFHRQDVERAIEAGVLCLAYAAATDLDDDFRVIGREIADAFEAAGFDVAWNRDPGKRIELRGIRWQKRRASRE